MLITRLRLWRRGAAGLEPCGRHPIKRRVAGGYDEDELRRVTDELCCICHGQAPPPSCVLWGRGRVLPELAQVGK